MRLGLECEFASLAPCTGTIPRRGDRVPLFLEPLDPGCLAIDDDRRDAFAARHPAWDVRLGDLAAIDGGLGNLARYACQRVVQLIAVHRRVGRGLHRSVPASRRAACEQEQNDDPTCPPGWD